MPQPASPGAQSRALWLSTVAFTACFAVWTLFSVIGVQVKKDLGLTEFQFGLLVGTPILTGSLIRLLLGIWADQVGGRLVYVGVMLAGAAATGLLTFATDYTSFLVAALGVGIAGGSFAVGITYVSQWYPKAQQGLPLGIFGAGNVGSAVTKLLAPVVMVAFGWKTVALVWAAALVVMALVFWFGTTDDPHLVQRRAEGRKANKTANLLEPLRNLQVWRFSLYYFFAFGGFVALALWLPHYFNAVYGLPIIAAGILGAAYSIPGSLFRVLGGYLSDKLGARRVMYWMFFGALASLFVLAYPAMSYHIDGIHGPIDFTLALDFVSFTVLIFALGFFMSLGKAAVYKHIPVYYPDHVGPVGGVVGLMGGLGGWLLPMLFGWLNDLTGVWTSCFMLLFALAGVSLLWMHLAIRASEKLAHPELGASSDLPELGAAQQPAGSAPLAARILGVAPRVRTQD